MTLENYMKKRKWGNGGTTEPMGDQTSKRPKSPIYVIQLHDATHLHRDLRLEMDGILKSWAIPKDPLLTEDGKKLLAVQTEDHPIEYSLFEGTIPEGKYGAGTVKIWDKGTFELLEKTDKSFTIKINGNKLKGEYILVKFKPPKNWLFFKKKG